METFDFPYHRQRTEYPQSGNRIQLGNGYVFTSPPNAPDLRTFTLSFPTMFYYPNTTKELMLGGNQGFENGLTGWGPFLLSPATSPNFFTDATSPLFQSSYQGRAGVAVSTPGMGGRRLYSYKLYPIDTSRKYRIRTSVYVGPGGTARTSVGMRCLDAAAMSAGGTDGRQYSVINNTVLAENSGWTDRTSGVLTGETGPNSFNVGTKQIQLFAYLNYDNTPGTETALDGIWIEDVTDVTVESSLDLVKNAAYNMGALEAFYNRHKLHKPFIYPHPVYGNIEVRFMDPLKIPEGIVGGNGALEDFTITLIENNQ